jgi:hypothetical protein
MAKNGGFETVRRAERDEREIDEALGKRFKVLDPKKIEKSIGEALGALDGAMVALRATKFEEGVRCPKCKKVVSVPLGPRDLAQVTAYTAKVVDMVYRLSEFAAGRPDSRPEQASAADLLTMISDDQLQTLMGWVDEAKGRRVVEKPKDALLQ